MRNIRSLRFSLMPLLAVGAAVSSITASACPAASVDPPSETVTPDASSPLALPKIDASAIEVFERMQKAMAQFSSYHAECRTIHTPDASSGSLGDAVKPTYEMAMLTARKPNLMHYDEWEMTVDAKGNWTKRWEKPTFLVVCDGKTHWTQVQNSYYLVDKNVEPYQLRSLKGEPWEDFFDEGLSPCAELAQKQRIQKRLDDLRQKQKAQAQFQGMAQWADQEKNLDRMQEMMNSFTGGARLEVKYLGVEVVEGVVCDMVSVHAGARHRGESDYRTTYYIDADGLLRRRVQNVHTEGQNGFTEDAVLRNVQINNEVADPQTLFSYTPPAGVIDARTLPAPGKVVIGPVTVTTGPPR